MTGTIQTAIDALPATGAEVKLLDGTYNLDSAIVGDSYQTLRGCGYNTILTATTAAIDIITVTGSSGSEKVGVTISDLRIDGDAGGESSDNGIYLQYTDRSIIKNIWSHDNTAVGLYADRCDFTKVILCDFQGNTEGGIWGSILTYCKFLFNDIDGGTDYGIELYAAYKCGVAYNAILNSGEGLYIYDTTYTDVDHNLSRGNQYDGLYLRDANHCILTNNTFTENSQDTDNTYDDMYVKDSDYNTIRGNICRAGGETNKPRYGINISDAASASNKVINNDLYDDGFGTAPYSDSGTGTIYVEPGIDDTPVNGETGQPISSNWAFDHAATDAVADDSTKGHATFEADDFDDSSGKIDLATSVCKVVAGDSGTATPSTHQVTVAGTAPISTAGASATVTVSLDTDGIDKTHLSQDFGASAARLRNMIMTPISGEILRISDCSGTYFSGLINTAGTGGLTATNIPYDGDSEEGMFNGLFAYDGSAYWGQIILHNTTKTESCKIVSVDIANNAITVTADSPDDVSAWGNNDVITCGSQTTTNQVDIDISDNVGTGVAAVVLLVVFQNNTATANANNALYLHPYVSYNAGKRQWCKCAAASECTNLLMILPVTSQKITANVLATGQDDFYVILSCVGTLEFADT